MGKVLRMLVCSSLLACAQAQIGVFASHTDVGTVLHTGSVDYDAATHSYTIGGSGENMWFAEDDFQFVWTKMSGDVRLSASVSILDKQGDAHRKAVLMIRQSLDPDAAYADVALHGDGLTSLQFREAKGAVTHEIESNVSAPKRLSIEKRGDSFTMWIGAEDGGLRFAGGSTRVPLQGPFYVGIGVCAHNKDDVRKALFSDVELTTPSQTGKPAPWSTLETITVASTDARVSFVAPGRLESPGWSHDGLSLFFHRDGRMERVAVAGGKPEAMATANSEPSQRSPDGKTLVFRADRDGKADIYTKSGERGEEKRLTAGNGVNDAPEFSPDGSYIYFQSGRTGTMQIWRMRPDGSAPEQVTSDEFSNAFPHLSPDGRQMAFLSWEGGGENMLLRVLSLSDRKAITLCQFAGGRGSMDAPSWSPDGHRLAFVSYQLIQ
ncbi:MAG: hypothetical protein ABSH47_16600 [Bryobacteraceae bacterium]|jgi:hypothetical protein